MVLALRAATDRLIVAHVVHDQRPRAEAMADCDAVARLARVLGLAFVHGEATGGAPGIKGNVEANLRRARYAELTRLAHAHGARWVATAHHATDQAESVLMALLRGSGPAGLSGIAPSRRLAGSARADDRIMLIRPMLGIDPAHARRICTEAGWAWHEDPTNRDESRLRARLRKRVIPELIAARPAALRTIAQAAVVQRRVDVHLRRASAALLARAERALDARGRLVALAWRVDDLRGAGIALAGSVLRDAFGAVRLASGRGRAADRLSARQIEAALRMLGVFARGPCQSAGGHKVARWAGVDVRRLGETVEVRRAAGASENERGEIS